MAFFGDVFCVCRFARGELGEDILPPGLELEFFVLVFLSYGLAAETGLFLFETLGFQEGG